MLFEVGKLSSLSETFSMPSCTAKIKMHAWREVAMVAEFGSGKQKSM